jgi:PAS domain S-box-containing protein
MTLEPTLPLESASGVSSLKNEPRTYRVMLGLGGVVYLAWWFAVEWVLPGAFNPLASRLAVVAYFVVAYLLTFVSEALKQRAETLFYVGATFLVGHYFYLFHHNAGDINWVVGAYVVVFALLVTVHSRPWLIGFSGFCLGCGVVVWWLDPVLRNNIFLPGLATILTLCLTMILGRIRLLERLEESAARFESLFDATFEGVSVHDAGIIVDANAAFAELFGYAREELIGRSVVELAAPVCRERITVQIRDTLTGRYEAIGLRKDGTEFAAELSTKLHTYQGRLLRLAAVRDISDRQRAEHERLTRIQEQAARAAAQEAIRLRDEFISIASHELRTPITSLLLRLDVFARHSDTQGPKDIETYAIRTRRQLARMERLVQELLDVSRLGAGQLTLTKESVDLEELVNNVVDSLAEDLRRAGCEVAVHSAGPLEGRWDRLRLEQVVENLLRNALIYGAGKPITLTIARGSEGRAVISVEDHGMGIDKAMQDKVFLRFERGVSAHHYGGLGLGLYISRQIVEAHQGTVRVESELDKGSTFIVELPLQSSKTRGTHELTARA